MSNPIFELIQQHEISTLNARLEIYQHAKTGAKHVHIATQDNNNVFLVGFLTVPQDSTGVAHILEHTSLCGSKNYPVRDPFFMMTRRSLNTFMNAFTSSDWTAYPFASQNQKDFNNLMDIYLDAAFFPLLDELDFAQEGHRLEFETADDANSPLTYKGVVFNEMKGTLSSAPRRLMQAMQAHIFPTITYHHNSGGEPTDIPNLSHEQLKAFHALHYHPTNAVFMTYGDLPASEHQARFEDKVLQHFDRSDTTFSIPNEQRYNQPQRFTAEYPLETNGDDSKLANKTHVTLGWLLGNSQDPYEKFKTVLMASVLLDNSASPLRFALEQTDLGKNPSPLCFADTESHESSFYCGLEGCDTADADKIEAMILDTLTEIAEQGVDADLLESVLHQLELEQREVGGGQMPYGLHLLVHLLSPCLYGADPLPVLDIDPILARLRQDIKNPDFIKNLIKTQLLDNPHRVLGVMSPSADFAEKEAQAEKAELAEKNAALSEADKQQIIQQSQALKQRQETPDDPELLPKVTLADVGDAVPMVTGTQSTIADMPVDWYAQGTNGMVYQTLVLDLPPLDADLIDVLPLYCAYLTEVGVDEDDYLHTQKRQSAVTGGISASYTIHTDIHDTQQCKVRFKLSSKALNRNQAAMVELLQQTFCQPRFDEHQRLRDLITQSRESMERSIDSRAMDLARATAVSGLSPSAALSNHLGGFASIQRLRALDEACQDEAGMQAFADKLAQIQQQLMQAARRLLVISEASEQEAIAQSIQTNWQAIAQGNNADIYQPDFPLTDKQQAWCGNVQVNFNIKAYPAPAYQHPDTPVLNVLGHFLRNGFLHTEIREKGGAYGGGASLKGSAFVFMSYRDPHLKETLGHFDQSLRWLIDNDHPERALEEAILGVIQQLDKPSSPAGEARGAFFSQLQGITSEMRHAYRQRVLDVSLDDLKRVANTWLQADKAQTVVFSYTEKANQEAQDLGLEVCQI